MRTASVSLLHNKIREQELNLNRSWYKDHSHAYNTPFCFESYTKDLPLQIFTRAFKPDTPSLSGGVWTVLSYDHGQEVYGYRHNNCKAGIPTFSRDSDLEAFSRNPTHGSLSALTFQSTDLPIM